MEELSLPNGRILLEALMLTPEMLRALPKVPVPVPALRALVAVLVSSMPFDEKFYAATYPDLAHARAAGTIPNLREHFVQHGYLEGRLGAKPEVDEAFYRRTYADVAAAIASGATKSGYEHYVGAGASEGRFASPRHQEACRHWQEILRG